jgi:glucokinase
LPQSVSTCLGDGKAKTLLSPERQRRDRPLNFNLLTQDSKKLVCAVDLGGTNLRAANIDGDGRVHERVKIKTPATDKPEDIVSAIAAVVRECETQCSKRGAAIHAISVVVPGSVQPGTGVVVNAPNIPSIADFKLGVALENELKRSVLLENDANAAAVGEMWRGAARNCQTIICLTLGTGVGSGVVLNGELWRGIDGTAGEIGHTSVEPFGGVKCKCGNIGCLEVYASATAIVRLTRERLPEHPESILRSIADNDLNAEKVATAAVGGDKFALDVFCKMGIRLGVAMANVVNIFNPEMIVVGGGVSAAWELFAHTARDEIIKRAFPVPARRCRIARAECGDDAGLLGAAWLALGRA